MDRDMNNARDRQSFSRAAVVLAATLLAAATPVATLAFETLDQNQDQFGGSKALIGTHEDGSDVRQAQLFMAEVTGSLDQIEIPVRAVGNPGVSLLIEIRDLDGFGLPGNVLASFPMAQGAVPACNTTACVSGSDYTTFTWVTVPVSPAVSVTANTQYVIELSATNANLDIYGDMTGRTVNRYEWAGVDNEFTYDLGAGLSYVGSIGHWFSTNADRAFKTYVNVPPLYTASVQAPINLDGSSNFKAKGTVPVRFALADHGSPTCSLPAATIVVSRTSGAQSGPINEDIYTFAADDGSNFRVAGCQYTYNLNSKGLGAGNYRVDIKIGGQTVGSASFELR
jgi:hypothetical protein